MKRIVLGFSGSAVTTAAIPWLAERFGAEVVTVTLDFGQGDELAAVRERALALGAVRAHVVDAREELVRDYLLPALQAGAMREGHALVHPLISKRLVDLARMESAFAIAHGAPAGSLAEANILNAVKALAPALEVIAPAAEWRMSDGDLSAVGRKYGVHAPSAQVRVEASLWGRRIVVLPPEGGSHKGTVAPEGGSHKGRVAPEGGSHTEIWGDVAEEVFTLTRNPGECPDDAALVDIQIAGGVPVAANGVEMTMIELIESLETIAGAHGVGRIASGNAVLEMPAASVLSIAHDALERRVLGEDLAGLKRELSAVYAAAVENGRWFTDIREAIDAFVRIVQPRVTGTVKLQLVKGQATVVACSTNNDVEAPRSGTAQSQAVA